MFVEYIFKDLKKNVESLHCWIDLGFARVYRHFLHGQMESLTAANWVSFDFNVSYSSC